LDVPGFDLEFFGLGLGLKSLSLALLFLQVLGLEHKVLENITGKD